MQLFYKIYGSGVPIIILHGLFGSHENWRRQSKILAEQFQIISVDLRNHGNSPHDPSNTYADMQADLLELMDNLKLKSAIILGHSMGGKVAMQLAMQNPERVKQLVVVDMAPVAYKRTLEQIFKALGSLDLANISSRKEADQLLTQHINEASMRGFLLKNLSRDKDNNLAWRCNLKALGEAYENIRKAPEGVPYIGPTLFIKGALSNYITAEYERTIAILFPKADIKTIEQAGHWPHAEQAENFNAVLQSFLTY